MNVAMLCGLTRSAGGIFYAGCSLSKQLNQYNDLQISIFGAQPELMEDIGSWSPLPVKAYRPYGPLQFSFALRHWLRDSSIDLVHRHGIWTDPQWAALQWQKRNEKPVVISPHGMLDPWAVGNSSWKKKLAGKLFANESLRRANCIHALCRSEVESIRAYGLKNPVACIPNGIELPDAVERRERAGKNKKQLLFLGRIHPKKGIAELLQAWNRLSACRKTEWELLIAGWDDGSHEEGLKTATENMGLSGSVRFLGPKYGKEKDELLRSVDAFVLPSYSEGLPMSVLEAWAYGLPVLMTEFCNIPEGFAAEAAIRIEPNKDSVAGGLEELCGASSDELETMGAKGRALVEEKFTWGKIASDMNAVYEWCLGGGDAPACIDRI